MDMVYPVRPSPLISRRDFVAALGALSTLPLTPLVSGCGPATKKSLPIAAHIWPGYESLFIARREGWLDERRVRLVETTSATQSLHALASGIVDGAALTLDEVLCGRAGGLALEIVLVFDISAGVDVVLARPDIRKLADLKGRRIGVEQGALGALILTNLLQAARLAVSDVQQVPLTINEHLDAWRHGQIDAVVTYPPVSVKLMAEGAHPVFDSRQIPETIVDVLAIRADAEETSAGSIRHLLSNHFRALDSLLHFRKNSEQFDLQHLGLSHEELSAVLGGLVFPNLASNRRLLGGPNPGLLNGSRSLSGIMHKAGLLPREDNLAALLNADFLPPRDES